MFAGGALPNRQIETICCHSEPGDPLVAENRIGINTWALAARLPTMSGLRELVETGGLMSYGSNIPNLFRRAAD